MQLDIFFSICQTEVQGIIPSERQMFANFFEQLAAADRLGFGTAWVAESHLSCEVQKRNPGAVIPHFKGEIGLNVDLLQLAHVVFNTTDRIQVGSAVLNILANGGPIAHAERIRFFLAMHGHDPEERRRLEIGFAAGRFPFINVPYGVVPRNEVEKAAWSVVRGKIFRHATEVFLRLLRGDILSSEELEPITIRRSDFRTPEDWAKVVGARGGEAAEELTLPSFYRFPYLRIIPQETALDLLRLTIGTHEADAQEFANRFLPVGVFNLSITSPVIIEETNRRMEEVFHPDGGPWKRSYMPRTVLVFINEDPGVSRQERIRRATATAEEASANYWRAIEGTLAPERVRTAVNNALVGDGEAIADQIRERFHPEDRLMLWFDFNNHDSPSVVRSMELFMAAVTPRLQGLVVR